MRTPNWLRAIFKGLLTIGDIPAGAAEMGANMAMTRFFAAFEPIAFEVLDEPYLQALKTEISRNDRTSGSKHRSPASRKVIHLKDRAHQVPNKSLTWVSLN